MEILEPAGATEAIVVDVCTEALVVEILEPVDVMSRFLEKPKNLLTYVTERSLSMSTPAIFVDEVNYLVDVYVGTKRSAPSKLKHKQNHSKKTKK